MPSKQNRNTNKITTTNRYRSHLPPPTWTRDRRLQFRRRRRSLLRQPPQRLHHHRNVRHQPMSTSSRTLPPTSSDSSPPSSSRSLTPTTISINASRNLVPTPIQAPAATLPAPQKGNRRIPQKKRTKNRLSNDVASTPPLSTLPSHQAIPSYQAKDRRATKRNRWTICCPSRPESIYCEKWAKEEERKGSCRVSEECTRRCRWRGGEGAASSGRSITNRARCRGMLDRRMR